jgi:hypothetical protein
MYVIAEIYDSVFMLRKVLQGLLARNKSLHSEVFFSLYCKFYTSLCIMALFDFIKQNFTPSNISDMTHMSLILKSQLNILFLAATCGGTIRGYKGRVTLPTYPGQYPNNLDCTWRIIGPPDHYLVLWFDELSMPYSHNCTVGDYVAVTEKMPISNSSGKMDCFSLL